MAVNPSPFGPKPQFELADGTPAVGNKLFFYVAGSVNTKQNTYTSSTGATPNTNPIILNSLGQPPNEIWFTAGLLYKGVYAPSTDTDPPSSPIWTIDNLKGINDTTTTFDEWLSPGFAPTFVSTTSFTLVGDQTTEFTPGRRVKTVNSGGTIYSTITTSVFGALTTVTVVNDSGVLDSGLSSVSYGILRAINPSEPIISDSYALRSDSGDSSKKIRVELGGLTTATTRIWTPQDQSYIVGSVARSHLAGLTLSTAGASTTMTIAVGQATDSTNVMMMTQASSIAKTTGAWAVGTGNGGKLSAAAIANNTWYHFYEIMRPDTGVVDTGFDLSATTPTMPSNYTLSRRIGAWKTNGSAQWVSGKQVGDEVLLDVSVLDVDSGANPGIAAITATLPSVPTGVPVQAIVAIAPTGTTNTQVYLSSLDQGDQAPSTTAAPLFTQAAYNVGNTTWSSGRTLVRTNTSAQVRYRLTVSDASITVRIVTYGWVDRRGRDD